MFRSGLLVVITIFALTSTTWTEERPKHILMYTSPVKPEPNWHFTSTVEGREYFEKVQCAFTNCIVTSDQSYLADLRDFDVIAFNSWNVESFKAMPPPETRHPDQIYLVYYHESPTRTKGSLSNLSTLFNWTMSYALNADVVIPYGHFIDKRTRKKVSPAVHPNWMPINYRTKTVHDPKVIALVKAKTKMAAWFVSSCYSPSQRKFVAQKLQEFFPVDIYGKCGTMTCGKESKSSCRQMVERNYKFYLSFENSLCVDYVTEKALEMMNYYVIPVVYGGADYNRFLPPGSYINVMDFDSVEDLVAYLEYVANDPEEYMKYFWWKDHYETGRALDFCPLCTKLNEKKSKTQYYNDLDNWFKNGTCLDPADVPLVRKVLIQYGRMKV